MPRVGAAYALDSDGPAAILRRTAKQLAREGRQAEARALVEDGIAEGIRELIREDAGLLDAEPDAAPDQPGHADADELGDRVGAFA